MNPPGVVFDEEQHLQPLEPDGIDGEEVARDDPGGLSAQERPPRGACPAWSRPEPVAAQRGSDRGGRNPNLQAQQLTLDPLVAPAGILYGEADDQLLQVL